MGEKSTLVDFFSIECRKNYIIESKNPLFFKNRGIEKCLNDNGEKSTLVDFFSIEFRKYRYCTVHNFVLDSRKINGFKKSGHPTCLAVVPYYLPLAPVFSLKCYVIKK